MNHQPQLCQGQDNGADNINIRIPLRTWIQEETALANSHDFIQQQQLEAVGRDQQLRVKLKKQSLLRKTTVAFSIAELLRRANNAVASTFAASEINHQQCTIAIDNFVVHTIPRNSSTPADGQWNNISGVGMVLPRLSANITEPSFLTGITDENDALGRHLEVEIIPLLPAHIVNVAHQSGQLDEDLKSFGALLYEIYSGVSPTENESNSTNITFNSAITEPPRTGATSTVRYDKKKGKSYSRLQSQPYAPLHELGLPSCICLLVHHLMDGRIDFYPSLNEASHDIHMLLCDPDCYLSDLAVASSTMGVLPVRTDKLYGREKEKEKITEAFCRVSSGHNEAFFIGGYSGAGKTMLVKSLTNKIDISGGYVLTEKFDQVSCLKPSLWEVLSAFNKLCLLVRERNSPQELLEVSSMISKEFETDFSILARLLPNISTICPLLKPTHGRETLGAELTLQECHLTFTLQRFLRVVSSPSKPFVLILDDLQWATSLNLIQVILSDKSCCVFFIGMYRHLEVEDDDAIFELMANLDARGVRKTEVHLSGLNRDDLNSMVAETLQIFPRLSMSFSDTILQKTSGNPFFAREYMKSLVDSRMLKYSLRQRRWIWDGDEISSDSTTDNNVLRLLSNKMCSLPESTQKALKIASCFGIKVDESIVTYLGSDARHSGLTGSLDVAIEEGYMQRVSTYFVFMHDKQREAAYSLIADEEKDRFHYDLGMLLYSSAKSRGKDVTDDVIQKIVDQINCGLSLVDPTMKMEIAELNIKAGTAAMGRADFDAANLYFKIATTLLADVDVWATNYELSLRFYSLKAKSAYCLGSVNDAISYLLEILERARCFTDEQDAYYHYALYLFNCDEMAKSLAICIEVLSYLGESIPKSIDKKTIATMMKQTGAKLAQKDILSIKDADNKASFTLKMYALLMRVGYWTQPDLVPYVVCRNIELSLDTGVCVYTALGLSGLAAILCEHGLEMDDIRSGCNVGKLAMALMERYNHPELIPSLYMCYYGFVAPRSEPLQHCAIQLMKGFDVGMSSGVSAQAFLCSVRYVICSVFHGRNLLSLLKTIDQQSGLMNKFQMKVFLRYLILYRETVSILIDKGASTKSDAHTGIQFESVQSAMHERITYIAKAIQAFWLGYSQRCQYSVEKLLSMPHLGREARLIITFYAAMNSFRGLTNKNGIGSKFTQMKKNSDGAIKAMKSAAELNPNTFLHKVHMLEAQLSSFGGKTQEAQESFIAAIKAAKSSGFVHEEALACENFALHWKKNKQTVHTVEYFQRAKACYTEWGSQMKVEYITQQIEMISR